MKNYPKSILRNHTTVQVSLRWGCPQVLLIVIEISRSHLRNCCTAFPALDEFREFEDVVLRLDFLSLISASWKMWFHDRGCSSDRVHLVLLYERRRRSYRIRSILRNFSLRWSCPQVCPILVEVHYKTTIQFYLRWCCPQGEDTAGNVTCASGLSASERNGWLSRIGGWGDVTISLAIGIAYALWKQVTKQVK